MDLWLFPNKRLNPKRSELLGPASWLHRGRGDLHLLSFLPMTHSPFWSLHFRNPVTTGCASVLPPSPRQTTFTSPPSMAAHHVRLSGHFQISFCLPHTELPSCHNTKLEHRPGRNAVLTARYPLRLLVSSKAQSMGIQVDRQRTAHQSFLCHEEPGHHHVARRIVRSAINQQKEFTS